MQTHRKHQFRLLPDSPVQITKAVSAENGAYKLTLDAYATGTVSTTDPTPSDIDFGTGRFRFYG